MSTPEQRARKAEAQRRWRAKKGARTGKPGPEPSEPCGTPAAYARHLRHGEPTCGPCRVAHNAEKKDQRLRREAKRKGSA